LSKKKLEADLGFFSIRLDHFLERVYMLLGTTGTTSVQLQESLAKTEALFKGPGIAHSEKVSDSRGNPKQGRTFHLPLSETAPLDSQTPERWDEEPSLWRCYPSPQKPEHGRRQLMSYRAVTHIALIVSPLRQAEEFYQTLFALEVAFREAETAAGWYTLPSDAGWDDAQAAGITLSLCSLHRDAFTLALEAGSNSGGGRLSHIGVQVDAQELSRLRVVASTLGCQVVQDGQAILVFDDPYGVRWEMTTSSYDDPRRLSTGARMGRWLTIGQQH
jgi:catechol 2,3-dioxygenase-like lactoylglutathione lyase family enzyme